MPRYYFDVISDEGVMRDDEGADLPHSDAVRAALARIALDFAKDEMEDQQAVTVTVNVRDDSDFIIFTGVLSFSTQWFG